MIHGVQIHFKWKKLINPGWIMVLYFYIFKFFHENSDLKQGKLLAG